MNNFAYELTDSDFKQHDEIKSKIAKLNYKLGLKSIMCGAWTYDKLAKNASKKLNISYQNAYKMGVDKLISIVKNQ